MAGTAKGDIAACDTRGGSSQSHHNFGGRPVWRNSIRGAIARGGTASNDVRDLKAIQSGVAAFAGVSNAGLIVTAGGQQILHRDLIITLAARHKLPAVYSARYFVTAGGLMSYGPNLLDLYQRAAGYVDRVLKGENPADLPVQAPTKF